MNASNVSFLPHLRLVQAVEDLKAVSKVLRWRKTRKAPPADVRCVDCHALVVNGLCPYCDPRAA